MKTFLLFRFIRGIYNKVIANEKDEVNFWILIAFIITFVLSRLTVYFTPWLYVTIGTTHIHHFSYGFFILAIVGLFALNDVHHKKRRSFGTMYGIGLALIMDEFGIWIHLDDNYWVRHSYDAILVTLAILLLLVYFDNFWRLLLKKFSSKQLDES